MIKAGHPVIRRIFYIIKQNNHTIEKKIQMRKKNLIAGNHWHAMKLDYRIIKAVLTIKAIIGIECNRIIKIACRKVKIINRITKVDKRIITTAHRIINVIVWRMKKDSQIIKREQRMMKEIKLILREINNHITTTATTKHHLTESPNRNSWKKLNLKSHVWLWWYARLYHFFCLQFFSH